MQKPKVAIISFPGMNCEIESVRALKRNGMEELVFRWNDDREKLRDADAYFLPGGFSYEDRGRSGMVAARDSLMEYLREEAAKGKVIIGNCNGAQILVESGLIPLDRGLRMSLAQNVVKGRGVGFLSQWVWITPTCKRDRCATSNWGKVRHIYLPIAHGEGRFTTRDPDVVKELQKNDLIAFCYSDASGKVSEDPIVTPNGSLHAIAGLCNPAGNVVALMPHPERTPNGDPYFQSMKRWLTSNVQRNFGEVPSSVGGGLRRGGKPPSPSRREGGNSVEIFIDTIIVNNEERTMEQVLRKFLPTLCLKQMRYLAIPRGIQPKEILSHVSLFNSHKEIAYIRRGGEWSSWDHKTKREKRIQNQDVLKGSMIIRTDDFFDRFSLDKKECAVGTCYLCKGIQEQQLSPEALEVFANPHASTLSMGREI